MAAAATSGARGTNSCRTANHTPNDDSQTAPPFAERHATVPAPASRIDRTPDLQQNDDMWMMKIQVNQRTLERIFLTPLAAMACHGLRNRQPVGR